MLRPNFNAPQRLLHGYEEDKRPEMLTSVEKEVKVTGGHLRINKSVENSAFKVRPKHCG